MKSYLFGFFLFFALQQNSLAQASHSKMGVGYSMGILELPEFQNLLNAINNANPGLTKTFIEEDQFQGYNLYWALKNNRSLTTIQYTKLNNKYRAEGNIPSISPNLGTYVIGSHHNLFSLQQNFMILKFFGIGAELGYHYSTFKNEQKDLFFGEVNSVVDKQGGGFYGLNALLHIPFGKSLHLDLQPFYFQAFKKIDMDNLPIIYLGANHQEEKKASVGGMGAHIKMGITF